MQMLKQPLGEPDGNLEEGDSHGPADECNSY